MSKKKLNAAQLFGRAPRKTTVAHAPVSWKLPDQSVGLEVEIEQTKGSRWPANIWPFWNQTRDGSLRNGREYVLAMPLKGDALSKAVHDLFHDGKWERTSTGSTHIHLDMMEEETTIDVIKVLTLMVYSLEDAVFRYLNAGREWCGYTNKLASAPETLISSVLNASEDDGYNELSLLTHDPAEIGRYYGLNIMALRKYGSIEFRYFPTATTKDEIVEWVQMMMSFKKAALEIGTVEALMEVFSSEEGYQRFMFTYFAEWADKFIATVPYYRAISMVKKAVAVAESNKRTNVQEAYTFAPEAITGNILLHKFLANPVTASAPPPTYTMLVVPYSEGAPTPESQPPGTLMLYSSNVYWRPIRRTDWISINDVAYEGEEEEQRTALYALETEQPRITRDFLRAAPYSYSNAHADYCINRIQQGINQLRSHMGVPVSNSASQDDTRLPPAASRWRVDYNDRAVEEALRGNEEEIDELLAVAQSNPSVFYDEVVAPAGEISITWDTDTRPHPVIREVPMPEPRRPIVPRRSPFDLAAQLQAYSYQTPTDSEGEF